MAGPRELWVERPSLTTWLPGETLFSLASRYHLISGNFLAADSCLQLFGHSKQGSAHDIPSRIDEFVARTRGELGDAESVIREHTLLPFYFPFRSPADEANAMATVRHGGIGGLKGQLGMLATRLGASHPLKACVQCIVEDRELHQAAYWHLEHQWPGSWVCRRHARPLEYAQFKTNGSGRFHWLLPGEFDSASGIAPNKFDEVRAILEALAECASGLGSCPTGFHFDREVLSSTYGARLIEMDCATASGRIKSADFVDLLEKICTPLSHVHGLEALSGTETSLLGQFSRLVREHRGQTHPIRHFVLAISLFGGWTAFMTAYRLRMAQGRDQGSLAGTAMLDATEGGTIHPQRASLVDAVRQGTSATAAANATGVSVATAMAWLSAAGVGTPRRPKVLVKPLRDQAIQCLRRGEAKNDVALNVGVSVQTITLLLRTEPGLRTAWNQAKFDIAQRNARTSWISSAARLRPATPKALRDLQPAVFAWLYRNDRAWLEEFSQGLERVRGTNHATVQWDARDHQLSQEVREVALELYKENPDTRLRLSMLCNRIPQLKARMSSLDQLPLTRAAIADATIWRRRRQ